MSNPLKASDKALARAEMEKAAGTARYTAGAFDEAIQHYTSAIELLPAAAPAATRASLYSNRAACQLMLKQWQLALDDSLQAIQSDPSFDRAYLRAGKAYLSMGLVDEARDMLRQCKDSNAAAELANIDKCEKLRRKAVELVPSNPQLALAFISQLLQITPADEEAQQLQVEALLGANQLDKAMQAADALYAADSGDMDTVYWRGVCLYRLGRLDEAAKHMRQVLSMDSQLSTNPNFAAAEKLLKEIRAAEVTAAHTAAASSSNDPLALVEVKRAEGTALYTAGQYEQAIQLYNAAIKLLPANAPATTRAVLHSNISAALLMLTEYEMALEQSGLAIDSDITYGKAYLRASKCLLAMGKYDRALYMLMQSKESSAAQLLPGINECELMQKRAAKLTAISPRAALDLLDQLIVRTPGNVRAHLLRVQARLDSDQVEQALSLADFLCRKADFLGRKDDSDVDVRYMHGLCLFRAGNLDGAAKRMQAVLKADPQYAAAERLMEQIREREAKKRRGSISPSTGGGKASKALQKSAPLLAQLPAALVPLICSHLSVQELLVTLARTAHAMRELLTPQCFAFHWLELSTREVAYLASRNRHSSFHAYALSQSTIQVWASPRDLSEQLVVDALHHFPVCKTLYVQSRERIGLGDDALQALLRHPTTRSCEKLGIIGFQRRTEPVPEYDSQQSAVETQAARLKRECGAASARNKSFSWAEVRLPATITTIYLELYGASYDGGVAFLSQNSALREIGMTTALATVPQLTRLFSDSATLPHLSMLWLDGDGQATLHNATPLVTALGKTEVGGSGKPRPLKRLDFRLPVNRGLLSAAAALPHLTSFTALNFEPGWLDEWRKLDGLQPRPFAQLDTLELSPLGVMRQSWPNPLSSTLPLFQAIAGLPLTNLRVCTNERVAFGADAIAQLARLDQLELIKFEMGRPAEGFYADWTKPALFAPLAARCLPRLHKIILRNISLSAESMVHIAAAVPQLKFLDLADVQLSCHPAVIYAILAGYCAGAEYIDISNGVAHAWKQVTASEVVQAYQSAVTAAGRKADFVPFTRLNGALGRRCWGTAASVWVALVALVRNAPQLRCVAAIATDDPLIVAAVCSVPSLTLLGASCAWPRSFVDCLQLRDKASGQYRHVSSGDLTTSDMTASPALSSTFRLTHHAHVTCFGPTQLKPNALRDRAQLAKAYQQQSLSKEQQAALTKWAAAGPQSGEGGGLKGEALKAVRDHQSCRPPRSVYVIIKQAQSDVFYYNAPGFPLR